MKTCNICGQTKELSEFYKTRSTSTTYRSTCRDCTNTANKEWQRNNRNRYNEIQARWRARHPEQALKKGKAWRTDNPERMREFGRKWARANREKVRAKTQRWAQANRARIHLYAQERRAREAGAAGSTTPEQLQARIDYYGGCCWICRVPYQAIDHVISLKNGGTNWPSNLRPICKTCNSAKGSKHPTVFLEQRAQASA